MTGAGVIGSICGDDAEGLVAGDLVQQVGQHGCVADPAAGDLYRPDFQRLCVYTEVNLAPVPWLGWSVFLDQPLAIAPGLHACAVDQQVQGAGAGR
jgi:hypothetical protein